MPNWLRTTLALLAGAVAGGASLALIEILGHATVDADTIFIVAVVGIGIAAFVGGSVAAWIGRASHLAWIVTLVLGLLSLFNVFAFKHPVWFVPVAVLLLAIGGAAANKLHQSRSSAA